MFEFIESRELNYWDVLLCRLPGEVAPHLSASTCSTLGYYAFSKRGTNCCSLAPEGHRAHQRWPDYVQQVRGLAGGGRHCTIIIMRLAAHLGSCIFGAQTLVQIFLAGVEIPQTKGHQEISDPGRS